MKSLLLFVCSFLPVIVFGDRAKPNVVYILADDLGYGDLKSMNPEGKIKTPGSDQMAREGMVLPTHILILLFARQLVMGF
jgi:hypothetical protein